MSDETGTLLIRCTALTRDLLKDTYQTLRLLDRGAAADALVGLLDADALAVIRRRAAEAEGRWPIHRTDPLQAQADALTTEWRAEWRALELADDAPLEDCVRCGATGVPLRQLTTEPGQVCHNSGACGRRRQAAAQLPGGIRDEIRGLR